MGCDVDCPRAHRRLRHNEISIFQSKNPSMLFKLQLNISNSPISWSQPKNTYRPPSPTDLLRLDAEHVAPRTATVWRYKNQLLSLQSGAEVENLAEKSPARERGVKDCTCPLRALR